jgi:CRISPR/Cas system CSM-associated protein Csm5 (group 7 of RAMP superfamily)
MMAKSKINVNIVQGFKNTQQKKSTKIDQTKKQKEEEKKQKEIQKQKELEEKRIQEEQEKIEQEKRKKQEIEKEFNKTELKTYRLKITTLSPVHIGDGTELEPISYVIQDKFLYSFDENYVLENILKDNKNIDINNLENMDTLVEFFKSYKDFIIKNQLYKSKIAVAKDIAKLYDNNYGQSNNNDESFNQMLIQKNIATINPYTNQYEPYIPGSSIKGAFQTILCLSVDESRLLKVSDTIGLKVENQIAWSLRESKKSKIPQKLEVISKGSIYKFEISKSNIFSFKDLKEKLHQFYQDNDSQAYLNFSREVRKENQFLLKIGRYIGQKFMANNPDIKQPKTKAMFSISEKNSKVELPFGWVVCEIIDD